MQHTARFYLTGGCYPLSMKKKCPIHHSILVNDLQDFANVQFHWVPDVHFAMLCGCLKAFSMRFLPQ